LVEFLFTLPRSLGPQALSFSPVELGNLSVKCVGFPLAFGTFTPTRKQDFSVALPITLTFAFTGFGVVGFPSLGTQSANVTVFLTPLSRPFKFTVNAGPVRGLTDCRGVVLTGDDSDVAGMSECDCLFARGG
jgi:hypothetical protein